MEKDSLKTPKNILVRMQIVHLGVILFNLQLLALIFLYANLFSFTLYIIYYTVLTMISVASLFLIFLLYPGFSQLWKDGTILGEIFVWLASIWQYVAVLVIGLSALSIVCLSFDRSKKNVKKIVVCAIVCILAIVFLILKKYVLTGGVQ